MSTLLEVIDLKKHFKTPRGQLHAVDGVTFKVEKGQTLGVVGESGCGKSTLGRTIIHLHRNSGGEIFFEGENISQPSPSQIKELRRNMQMIFQDPFSSLNPRLSISQIIAEPLIINKRYGNGQALGQKVARTMETVGLSKRLVDAYPHELDGGRRQRVGVARALALDPKFIVCDEPVSSLDVSIQAQILNLMQDIQKEKDLTYLFITHDLSVVKHISDKILVMYLGKMVEYTSAKNLFINRYHPYTQALLSAVPLPILRKKRKRRLLMGEIGSPIDPGPGCRFAGRCEYARDRCLNEDPELDEITPNHFVACHFAGEINGVVLKK